MTRGTTHRWGPLLALLACAAAAGHDSLAAPAAPADSGSAGARPGPPYQILVHPQNKVESVSKGFLRDAFLKKTSTWSGGDTIRPVDLNRRFTLRKQFSEQILKKTLPQARSYWNQLIFSGKGVPPPEKDSEAAVIAYVLANRGAVGYISASSDPKGARVVRLE